MKIKVKVKQDNISASRLEIQKLNGILEKFASEEGFEEYADIDRIALTVGDDTAETCFSPQTWEAAERFIMYCVCHLIESEGLDSHPYYREMADRYADALGEERGSFE